jgi:hypothetical protein
MRVFVELFAGGDFYAETVGRERNGAGGVGIIGAGRIVGLVEIELDGFAIGAVLGSFGIEEAGGWVGKFAASEIAKDDEETAVTIGFGFEAVFLAVQSEEDVTNDVIQRVGTEMVLAFVEPEEAGDGEPTVFGSELGFVIVAPFFDGLAISEGVRSGGAGEEKNCEKQSERALPTVKVHGMLPSRVNQNSTTNE